MERTLFQRIIDRDIPATIEYEDDQVIAIRDIAPSAPVHLLIIPKKVIRSVDDLQPEDAPLMGHIALVAQQLARKFNVAKDGYRLVSNMNAHGGQTVFHLHVHLLGGEPLGRMNSASHGHQPSSSGLVREAGLFVLAAIGLAIAFNMINPRQIPWVKPDVEHIAASPEELSAYLPTPAPESAPPTPAVSTDTTVPVEVEQSAPVPKEQPAFTPAPGVVREIDLVAFRKFLDQDHFLIDARLPESYAQGFIGSAVNVYGGEVQSRIGELLAMVPRDRVVLIYCDGGDECELSHHVADVLKQFGYGPLLIYKGGWNEWIANGGRSSRP